jgi:hypothetical protein
MLNLFQRWPLSQGISVLDEPERRMRNRVRVPHSEGRRRVGGDFSGQARLHPPQIRASLLPCHYATAFSRPQGHWFQRKGAVTRRAQCRRSVNTLYCGVLPHERPQDRATASRRPDRPGWSLPGNKDPRPGESSLSGGRNLPECFRQRGRNRAKRGGKIGFFVTCPLSGKS